MRLESVRQKFYQSLLWYRKLFVNTYEVEGEYCEFLERIAKNPGRKIQPANQDIAGFWQLHKLSERYVDDYEEAAGRFEKGPAILTTPPVIGYQAFLPKAATSDPTKEDDCSPYQPSWTPDASSYVPFFFM